MKKCPFCAEEIQSEAIKCRYCGERLDTKTTIGNSNEQIKSQEKLRGQDYSQHHEAPKAESPTVSSPKQSTVVTPPIEKKRQEPSRNSLSRKSGKFFGGIHHPWRRFFARTVDINTLGLLPFIVVAFVIGLLLPDKAGSFATALAIIAGVILMQVLWILIESVLLSTVGNTPGKWLFGISVRTTSGHKLSFSQALERSSNVLLQGIGLGIPPVALFTQFFAYRRLIKTGTTLWDRISECVVTHKTWGVARAIVCTLAVLLAFMLLALLNIAGKPAARLAPFAGIADEVYGKKPEPPSTPAAPAPGTPGSAADWFNKAGTLCSSEKCTDPQKAIEYLNEAIRLEPDYADAYYNRGSAYGKQGQYQRAIQDYDETIRLKPDDAKAYFFRGITYAVLERNLRAIQDYDEAIRLEPDFSIIYFSRGLAYVELEQYQRAIQDYDEAIRLEPDDAMAYYKRGMAYILLKQYQQAIQDYDEAIRLNPDFSMAYFKRGDVYNLLKQYQRAIQDYDEAIRLKPDYAAAYGSRGYAYMLSGNRKEGCRSFIRACELGDCEGYELGKREGYCR